MAQPIQTFAITAPGFYGLNTQDSSLDLASGFALVANNCVIDQYGRVGARQGWTPAHSTLGALGTADVKTIAELIDKDGTSYTLCAGNNKLFKLVGSTLTQLTFNGVGTAPTITDSNWSTAYLDGDLYFYQRGHNPLGFDPATSTTTYYRVDQEAGYNGTVQLSNIVLSAYGRLWNADTTTDKVTVQWSDIKNPQKFGSGTAGTLDTTSVWPHGGDTIVALAAHNNFLFIFGRRNILIYQGATSPASMTLYDVIEGIGCVARDSVCNTGTDIIFLSDTGVRSVMRTVQEKSAPLRDLSKNIRSDLVSALSVENLDNLKSVYSEKNAFYLLILPALTQVYCFDTKMQLPDGAARITQWNSMNPVCMYSLRNGDLYIGKTGYIGKYGGYLDNTSTYRFAYYTNHADLGNVNQISILKRIKVIVIGGSDQYVTIKWGFDFSTNYLSNNAYIPLQGTYEYGIAEYNISEYSNGVLIKTLDVSASGAGKVVQSGYETTINGTQLSIQKIELLAKNGKIG